MTTIYDERVNETLSGLAEGKSREEIADKFGYSSWKSLDIYLRRKGFRWIPQKQNYIPLSEKAELALNEISSIIPLKAAQILTLFDRERVDPRAIALEMGFRDHREMAEYMEDEGLTWSTEKRNYILSDGKLPKVDRQSNVHQHQKEPPSSFDRLLPLLELLDKHKDRLLDLLMPTPEGTIPRYIVPGPPKTKSFHMSDPLANLLAEFSDSKNVSQRDIIETAIIECMKRYGYAEEIDKLLHNSN